MPLPSKETIDARRSLALQFYKDWTYTGDTAFIPTRHGDVRVLIYAPPKPSAHRMPVFFNIHGGGFVVHKAEMDQPFCEKIACVLDALVISIDYSLAPEAPWPQQMEEAYDVMLHVWQHAEAFRIDPDRMAVGGHSAGGNIACIVAMMAAQQQSFALRCLLLDYPLVDWATPPSQKYHGVAHDMVADIEFFEACYMTQEQTKTLAYASPLYATDAQLQALPPTIFTLCKFDILRTEGEQMIARLIACGTEVCARLFPAQHGFTSDFYYTKAARDCHAFMIRYLASYL